MKRIIYIISAAVMAILSAACTKNFEEINTNPNKMEVGEISPAGLLPNIIYSGASALVSQTYILSDELIQYSVSANTTDAYHRYQIPNGTAASLWNNLARWAASADHMANLSDELANGRNLKAVAITLRSYYMHLLTDCFGDVPFEEAFKGMDGLVKPKFDTQKDCYIKLIADLEEANSLYTTEPSYAFSDIDAEKDLLYHGDIEKWQKFTNSLLVRVLNRLSDFDDPDIDAKGKLLEIFDAPGVYPVFSSNDDSAVMRFTGATPNLNPYGDNDEVWFESNRKAGEQIINLMKDNGDPRINIYFKQVGGVWDGAYSGGATREETGSSTASSLRKATLGDYNSPFAFLNYDEILFIWAECAHRGIIPGGTEVADTYYKAAVEASIRYWSANPGNTKAVTDAAIEQFFVKIPYDGSYENLMNQKYVALFWVAFEAWSEYRRTGYPDVTIAPTTMNDHILPRRLPYPVNTGATNPDNYAEACARLYDLYRGGDDMKTPVWWSKYRVENFR